LVILSDIAQRCHKTIG